MFVTRYYGAIKQCGEQIFNQWAANCFSSILGRRFTPHDTRRAKATSSVLEDGKSLESVQKLLGHSNTSTTQMYVIKDNEDDESDELFID
jgi:site-specific recombinase XerD